MKPTDTSARLVPGQIAPPFTRPSLAHGSISVPGGLTHLQFRRFAGCPICSLHLRTFARSAARFEEAGVRVVAVFHSSLEELASFHADLPFAVLGDPGFELYRLYGVERSWTGLLHPRAMSAGMRGLFSAPSSPFVGSGGHTGLPADFLIDAAGRLVAVHHGKHADDQWEVDEVLALAAGAPARPRAA